MTNPAPGTPQIAAVPTDIVPSTDWLWALLAVCVIGLGVGLRCVRRLRPLRAMSLVRDERGTASIEFTLVLPVLLTLGLLMLQVMWLLVGHEVLRYAAQAATRSAKVQIPAEYPGEPANQFLGGQKEQAIKTTAVMALLPIAGDGQGAGGAVQGAQVASALRKHYSTYGQSEPKWIDTYVESGLAYNDSNTNVTVLRTLVQPDQSVVYVPVNSGTFQAKDPIAVRIDYNLNLPVPYVNQVFADSENGTQRFMRLQSQHVMVNEGVQDKLPDPPSLPRRDP